uniref:Uncharacterized protein n=1 Tax=Esox lucius TaxID=8010 RepID=A0A3P8YVX7_ESOLU
MKLMQSSKWLSRSVLDSSRAWIYFILNDSSGTAGCSESTVSMWVMPALIRSWASLRSDAAPMYTPASTRIIDGQSLFIKGSRRPVNKT